MPPTFHYRPEPNPTYTYTDTFNNVTYTRRVSHSAGRIYWDDAFTKPGELTPTFVHTTTSIPSDGLVDRWTQESTHKYQKLVSSYKYPAFLERSPPAHSCYDRHRSCYQRHISPPQTTHHPSEGPIPI